MSESSLPGGSLPDGINPIYVLNTLALMKHFALCKAAQDQQWTGRTVKIGEKEHHTDFIEASWAHVNVCPAANLIVNPAVNPKTAAGNGAESPEKEPPMLLDFGAAYNKGILLFDTDEVVFGVDLLVDRLRESNKVGNRELLRIKASCIRNVYRICSPEQIGLHDGYHEIGTYEATSNIYLVLDGWAYLMHDVRQFLLYSENGEELRVHPEDLPYYGNQWTEDVYQAPPWYPTQSEQDRHVAGLTQQQLDAEQSDLLPDRAPGSATFGFGQRTQADDDTGLTELPRNEQPDEDDESPVEELVQQGVDDTHRVFDNTGDFWFTRWQKWVLQGLGTCAWLITLIAVANLMINREVRMNMLFLVPLCLIVSGLTTAGTAIAGAAVFNKYIEDPLFVRHAEQAQSILWTCGAILGWAALACVDLMFLL